MSSLFAVLLNGIAQIEYDRNKPLPDYQGAYLEKMDQKMVDEGISLGDTTIENPDLGQCAQFVAANLAQAVVTFLQRTPPTWRMQSSLTTNKWRRR